MLLPETLANQGAHGPSAPLFLFFSRLMDRMERMWVSVGARTEFKILFYPLLVDPHVYNEDNDTFHVQSWGNTRNGGSALDSIWLYFPWR